MAKKTEKKVEKKWKHIVWKFEAHKKMVWKRKAILSRMDKMLLEMYINKVNIRIIVLLTLNFVFNDLHGCFMGLLKTLLA